MAAKISGSTAYSISGTTMPQVALCEPNYAKIEL